MRTAGSRPRILDPGYQIAFALCVLIGLAGMAVGFALSPADMWLWLVVCFLIFSGITNGMLAWAAAFRITQARWTPAIWRICQSAVAFTPVLGIVLVALLAGARYYLPWPGHPPPSREGWFNTPFLCIREAVMLGLLWGLSLVMVRWSLAADEKAPDGDSITRHDHWRLNAISVGIAWVYVIASSFVSYDFVMGFAPRWVSTMFAPYYISTGMYMSMGMIIIISASLRNVEPARDHLKPQQFQDTGSLMLAFSLFNMGLFFAQYLTIWYENLPQETFFILIRYVNGPWMYPAWASFILGYGIPFILLQSRFIKHRARLLVPVVTVAMAGVALERYVLVVPSMRPHNLMLYPVGVLSVVGFAGLFALALSWFVRRYPLVSTANLVLRHISSESEDL